mmetsp:Transcript_17545/g.31874  ORF Transcript_17545/g.31874 Transcript_17545/m.31874 type:complete len:304 (-) Transcript_17545:150-1061(-)
MSIVLAVFVPNADSSQTLPHHVRAGNAAIQIIVRVSGTIPPIVRAEIITIVLPVNTLTSATYPIVNVHLGSKVRTFPKRHSRLLEILLKIPGNNIGGSRPQFVLDAIIGIRQRPRHLDSHGVIRLDLRLDLIRILLEHQKRRYGNIRTTPIIRHNRLALLTIMPRVRSTLIPHRAKTRIIRNNHPRGPHPLGIADLLDEGAASSIEHEDVGRLPWEHDSFVVLGADGEAGVGVDGVEVAEGVGGVVHVLGDGSAVGGDAEEGFAVFVASGLEQSFGDMKIKFARSHHSCGGILGLDRRTTIAA